MWWMLLTTLAIVGIIAAQIHWTPRSALQGVDEDFMNYVDQDHPDKSGIAEPDLADIQQGLPLSDFLRVDAGLNGATAAECAEVDGARVTEPGGSYVQRTNNFRHDYPDYCMARPDDFVASVYAPKMDALGAGVGCAGKC